VSQLAQLLLTFAACSSLALTMDRHRRDVGTPAITKHSRWLGKVAGILLLSASLAIAVVDRGWGIGSIEWVSVFGLSAICLILTLSYAPRAVTCAAQAAVAGAMICLLV
jgi:hypothetical protein